MQDIEYVKAEISRLKQVRNMEDHIFVKLLIDDKIRHLEQRLKDIEQKRSLSNFSLE